MKEGGQAMISKELIETFIDDVKRKEDNLIYQTSMKNAVWLKDNMIEVLQYIEKLETKTKKYELETIPGMVGELSAAKQVHEYDVQMIEQVKRKSSRII